MDPCDVWQTDWQDLEVERKPIPGYSPQGEVVKKHPSPREGIQKEAPVVERQGTFNRRAPACCFLFLKDSLLLIGSYSENK